MASTSKRQQRRPCLPSAALCALVVAASLGSALVRCQTGGFGSPSPGPGQCDASGPRQECGWNGIEDWKCASKGCCYDGKTPTEVGTANVKYTAPVCFKPNGGASTYDLSGGFTAAANGNGLQGTLKQSGTGTQPELGPDIKTLTILVENVTPDILHAKIGAPGRWEIPKSIFLTPNVTASNGPANYQFNYSASPFTFAVARADSNGEALFNTVGTRLVIKDQYMEISTTVPETAALYGLGERTSSTGLELRRDGIPLALWNRDHQAALPDQNVYGSHPILMDVREDGSAHGVLLLNSNAMDVVLTKTRVQWRVTGGVLDFYFLMGPTPNAVLDQLTTIIGRPVMPPYWSLGLMNSKYGYGSAEFYHQILNGYGNASIPLETFVSDSQYMNHDEDFTLGDKFPLAEMKDFMNRIKAQGQRWVPILDPNIHIRKGYAPYDSGIKQDIFMKDVSGKPYVGQLWPGACHWPDFKNPNATTWWTSMIKSVYDDLKLDGLWIDMNEPSNYCTGDVCWNDDTVPARNDFVCMLGCVSGRDQVMATAGNKSITLNESYFNPPYAINNGDNAYNISYKTVAITAYHYDGTLVYNAHNLYGMLETLATASALQKLRNKRQFILTRSTFLGSGAYAAHWTGDTNSKWEDMRWSIPTILNNGIAGISFSGADICGFMMKATDELCSRWAAVGAFYPYARNHHSDGWQEFFRWESTSTVARKVLATRYRLLPYLYTAFFDSHTYGCPVARPLFFTFPADNTTRNIGEQWMMGDALLVSPIMYEKTTSVRAYFPQGTWYDFYSGRVLDASAGGKWDYVSVSVIPKPPFRKCCCPCLPFAVSVPGMSM
ncbi:hypothetical protein COCSUDRAFT_31111 [Coccomyxa subellipsoidea C-169]|uniref:Maltase n=1 Tax=Coccomyxa subellipsoidea (strain C-169) TaxID=574566 RepID=I0YMX4_COCSC|nr:hypothetical protein COCSUDRAFT_31111 [Coccomyxa subellipsoidea C-169]EIE19743.1 hypothetical protein COCSUDRAFT_31111 [Coccomyxa subellipsoidea C-169]|eukprot:XP_005644287.1 hypothetical protein COCSUDRAFT_31111 [Coccomyxa subellipsoidea C-169]